MAAGAVFVALDDGGAVDAAVHRALLGVADALAAVGVEQMGRGYVAAADGGIGLEWNAHQAELQQTGPTGPAIRRGAGKRRSVGGVGREGIVHGRSPNRVTAMVSGCRRVGGPGPLSH